MDRIGYGYGPLSVSVSEKVRIRGALSVTVTEKCSDKGGLSVSYP